MIGDEPAALSYTLFSTSIGRCGIAWRGPSVVATQLPELSDAETKSRLLERVGNARPCDPPPAIARAIDAVTALLDGSRVDLSFIDIDLGSVPSLNARVYAIAREIPPGCTMTYGEIATRLKDKSLAQAVGLALARNPWPIIVPCHRVVGAQGKLTGFSAHGGVATKLRMLAIEGAAIGQDPELFEELPLAVKPPSPPKPPSKT
jgi:methylated-DNA-[protein]-cysteine S-methyltransferase